MFRKRILPLLMFVLLLFGLFIFPSIPIALFNIPYDKFDPIIQILYNFFCNVVFIIVLFLVYKDKLINDFKLYFKKFRDNFEMSFKYYFLGVVVMIVTNLIIALFFTGANAGNEEAVRGMIDKVPLYMIFSVSIYAPITEELIFRHSIKDCVITSKKNKFSKYFYVFISGFIFAFMHILGQTNSYIDYIYIIPYMSLGVAFASLYYDSNNIFSSIMMHALHNTVTIILYLMSGGIVWLKK